MASIPIIGTVAAGQPILAQQNIEGYFPVPTDVLPPGETFILNVKGDSMINAGIFEGDQLFIQQCNTARNGDIVVALVDDSATVTADITVFLKSFQMGMDRRGRL